MRLIDADELICNLSDYALQEAPNDNMEVEEREYQQQIYEVITCCIDAVVEQPTAYDVDKVVEEINDIVEHCDKRNEICMGVGDFRSSDREAEKMCVAIKCREIVKAGGRE